VLRGARVVDGDKEARVAGEEVGECKRRGWGFKMDGFNSRRQGGAERQVISPENKCPDLRSEKAGGS
jgi:hypothetical protein